MKIKSACIEMLFKTQADNFSDRIYLAHEAGFGAFEFWHWSNKNLDEIELAINKTGIELTGFLTEPKPQPNHPDKHDDFLDGLKKSISVAQKLGAKFLYMQGGDVVADLSREEQTASLIEALKKAAELLKDTGIILLLEPVSDNSDGFLELTVEGIHIVSQVNCPEVRLLYDIYHAAVLGEDLDTIVVGHTDLIGHIHVADYPGRGPEGSGRLDLDRLITDIKKQGYAGEFGYEYNE